MQITRLLYLQAIIGVAAGIVTLAAVFTVPPLIKTRDDLQSDVGVLQAKEVALNAKIAEAEKKLNEVLDNINRAQANLEQGNDKLAAKSLTEAKASVRQDPSLQPTGPLVYIQVRAADQAVLADKIAEQLRAANIRVPQNNILTDTGPQTSEVRYFRSGREQQEQAAKILDVAKAVVPHFPWKTNLITGYENSPNISANHYEIWLGPNVHADAGPSP